MIDPMGMEKAPPGVRRSIVGRVLLLVVMAISFYIVFPSLAEVLSAGDDLDEVGFWWFGAMVVAEAGSFVCVWWLQSITLGGGNWTVVATSQLASNAVSRVVPGGAAAAAAMQHRMLRSGGISGRRAASALTVSALLLTGTVLALPLLSLPAIIAGTPVNDGLAQAAWLGAAGFVLLLVGGAVLITKDGAIEAVGRAGEGLVNRVRRMRHKPPLEGNVARLTEERALIRRTLGTHWPRALAASVGKWSLDFLALLSALTAVGASPNPSIVLLAYCASSLLGMVPITPGGLGLVEAGLTATLALAGVPATDAVVATLAYRLVSFWLPLPVGAIAALIFRRTHGGTPVLAV